MFGRAPTSNDHGRWHLSGASGTQINPSCRSKVFVDESAESVASVNLVWRVRTDET
jgi:hypothetical protein